MVSRSDGVDNPAAGSWRRPAGWVTLSLGLVAAAAGGVLYGLAAGDGASLEDTVAKGQTRDGKVTALPFDDAQGQKRAIEDRLRLWGSVGAVGGVVAIVGAVLALTAPTPAAHGPLASMGPDGGWRFGWQVQF